MIDKRTKIMFYASLGIFIIMTLGLFLVINNIENRNKKVAEERAKLEQDVIHLQNMQQVRRSVVSSYEEQKELANYFIDEDSIPYFLGTIEAVAIQTDVASNISRVTLSPERNKLGIAMRATGDFENLHQYLQALELTPFKLVFQKVFLQQLPVDPRSGIGGFWSADFDITLESYSELSMPIIKGIK